MAEQDKRFVLIDMSEYKTETEKYTLFGKSLTNNNGETKCSAGIYKDSRRERTK